jgi:hypothetical protein
MCFIGSVAIFQQHFSPIVRRRWAIFHFHRSSKNSNKVKVSWIHKKDQNFRLTNFIFLNICLNLYLYDGIFIHLYEEIVNIFNSLIIPYNFRRGGIFLDQIKSVRLHPCWIIFFDRADVAGNLGLTEKTVLARWAYRTKATYSGSRQYIRTFFLWILQRECIEY